MNIAKWAMDNKNVVYFLLIITFFGGISSYNNLGKLEDAPFVMKTAMVITPYPGASQAEVESQVTDVIEKAVQDVSNFWYTKSQSQAGLSMVKVEISSSVVKEQLPQIWDDLRKKIADARSKLPAGAGAPIVNDDFGQVFGIFYALTGEGFEYNELKDYAEYVKRTFSSTEQVSRVSLFGTQRESVDITLSTSKLNQAGIHPNTIAKVISSQNKIVNPGSLTVGESRIRVEPSGTFTSVEEIENLLIPSPNGGQAFFLKDLATVKKSYVTPFMEKMRHNGNDAIGIGVATTLDGNAVLVGERIEAKIESLNSVLPVGIELTPIYLESKAATEATNNFLVNLAASIAIVLFILFFAMGGRSAVLLGSSLLFSILGTLIIMEIIGLQMQRVSLAAFIVAMGMLVDNAIVVTDNAIVGMRKGLAKRDALIAGATMPQWALLGATFIAVLSFSPLKMAPNNAGEMTSSLFTVLLISLMLSWIFALIQTTVMGDLILKEPKLDANAKDPYDNKIYNKFKSGLIWALKKRYLVLGITVAIFVLSIFSFKYVNSIFFPDITKPLFRVHYFLPQGTSVDETDKQTKEIENWLLKQDEVKNVLSSVGKSPLRFYLASQAWGYPHYSYFMVETNDPDDIDEVLLRTDSMISNRFPDAMPNLFKFSAAAKPNASIEAKFKGPDADTLRMLASKAMSIMKQESAAVNIHSDWGVKTHVWKPIINDPKARRSGITKEDVTSSIALVTDGLNVGVYREGIEKMPVYLKSPSHVKTDFSNLKTIPVFGIKGSVPLDEVVQAYDLEWEDYEIWRYGGERAIAAQCEVRFGENLVNLEKIIVPKIEAIALPNGYTMFWDGQKKSSAEAGVALASFLPVAVILILLILMFLFNSYKKIIIVVSIVPLILIGVVSAFLISGFEFDFLSIVGMLGLIGMAIKNGIVLLDQIKLELEQGSSQYQAIVNSAVSRAMPVSMAAGTTILGMIPLLTDPMFKGMAATIMGGLFIATILTLLVIPLVYAVFYKVKAD